MRIWPDTFAPITVLHTYKETYKGTYKGMYNDTYIETCKDLARHFFFKKKVWPDPYMSLYVCGYTSPYTLKKKVSGQILTCLYICVVIHALIRPLICLLICVVIHPLAQATVCNNTKSLICQERPTYMAKETYIHGKRDLRTIKKNGIK